MLFWNLDLTAIFLRKDRLVSGHSDPPLVHEKGGDVSPDAARTVMTLHVARRCALHFLKPTHTALNSLMKTQWLPSCQNVVNL